MTPIPVTDALPHRPPFLFLDEVVELEEGRLVARRRLDPDEDFFRGHYPGRPMTPGVLLCEMALQAGAYLMAHRAGSQGLTGLPVVTRIQNVRFKRPVAPGDVVDIEVSHSETMASVHWMAARLRVGGRMACDLSFAVTLVEEATS